MRLLAAVVLASSTAAAAPIEIHQAGDGSLRARQAVAPTAATAHVTSRTLYLHRDGGTVTPGNNNSQTNTSSIVKQPSTVAGWDVDDAKWAMTMSCVRAMWSPFDVEVTDIDPGSTPHMKVFVGGSPTSIGFPGGIGGVSPMAIDCSVVERSIVFVFPRNLHHDPQSVCEVIGQELGHSFGLDHELEPSDPMTYLGFAGERTFRDKTVACGETTARPCGIDGHVCTQQQNSFQHLLDRIGAPGTDHAAPVLDVVTPRDGDRVERGFEVIAHASDNVEVSRVTLFVDGGAVAVDTGSIAIATDPELPAGAHQLVIEVADTTGNTTTERLDVSIDDGGGPDFVPTIGCATGGDAGWLVALVLVGARRRRKIFSIR